METSGAQTEAAGDYVTVPASTVDDARLLSFAALVRPDPERLLSNWWRQAGPECAIAVVHRASDEVAALSSGRFCDWAIAGQVHPAVSIGDWFVHPEHVGKLLGRRMLRHFGAGRLAFGLSVSERGVGYVQRLRWKGPYRSSLLAMPLPRVARLWLPLRRGPAGVSFDQVAVTGGELPEALRGDLDRIDQRRLADPLAHMRRDSATWAWHLSIVRDRVYRFCVARRGGEPAGYAAVRAIMPGRSRQLGALRAALIVDLAVVDDDPEVTRGLAARAAGIAGELGAAVALFLTTVPSQQRIFARLGFLTPGFPVLGRLLARRSPVYVWNPRGPGSRLAPDRLVMTFADGMLDLDL